MKHLSGLFHKLTAVAAVAIALTSCNRAEYAMLPKTASAYHGTQRATIIKPAPTEAAATAPASVVTSEVAMATPVATPAPEAAVVAKAAAAPAVASTRKAPKLNFAQKALVQKIAKKADKLASKAGVVKKSSEVAAANRLEGKLRQGVILLLVGLLIELLGAATGVGLIYVLGAIVAIIGIVLIVLYLLDEL